MKITKIEVIKLRLPVALSARGQLLSRHEARAEFLAGGIGDNQADRQWSMSDDGFRDTYRLRQKRYEAFLKGNSDHSENVLGDRDSGVVCKVHTDEGLIGLSDSPPKNPDFFVGRSPFEFIGDDSVGGFQMALYDLMGKATGQPAARLIGPVVRTRILVSYWSHCYPPEVMRSEAARAVEMGFIAHKIKRRPLYDVVEQVEAMSEVIPEDYRIEIDSNTTLRTPARAIALARSLERFPNVVALEEPIPQDDIAGYRHLRASQHLPIIVDRPDIHWPGYWRAIVSGMCDGLKIGMYGVSYLRQNATLAEEGGHIPFFSDSGGLGIGCTFLVHILATITNATLPHSLAVYRNEKNVTSNLMKVRDGYVHLPEGPGLGVELDEDAIDNYRVH